MYQKTQPTQRLTRSPHGMIAGVCAGLSDYFGINLILIRIIFMVLGLANGIVLILYIILLISIPASPLTETSTEVSTLKKSRKTFFAYIAATVSACAALFSFFENLSSIFQAVDKYWPPKHNESFAPTPNGIIDNLTPPTEPKTYPSEKPFYGNWVLHWSSAGVPYKAQLNMNGQFGKMRIWYFNSQINRKDVVDQDMALSFDDNKKFFYLKGSNPVIPNSVRPHPTYSPDDFRLQHYNDGSIKIIEACSQPTGCVPVASKFISFNQQ